MTWVDAAACRDADPEIFFPRAEADDPTPALTYCYRCPVREACLGAALQRAEPDGIWGGKTLAERVAA